MNTVLLRETLNQAFMDSVICPKFNCISVPNIMCSSDISDEPHILCHLWINYKIHRLLKRERWSKHEPD